PSAGFFRKAIWSLPVFIAGSHAVARRSESGVARISLSFQLRIFDKCGATAFAPRSGAVDFEFEGPGSRSSAPVVGRPHRVAQLSRSMVGRSTCELFLPNDAGARNPYRVPRGAQPVPRQSVREE